MSLGLVGRKIGMTRVFAEDGASIPVTVLDMSNNRVTQIKTDETDGYVAVQLSFGSRKASRVNRAQAGHLAKAGVEAGRGLREFVLTAEQLASLQPGSVLSVEVFQIGQLVDVTGTSQGKGFRALLSAITSVRSVLLTVTPCRTMRQARSVWRKIQVVFFLVSVWLVSTVTLSVPCSVWKWFALMLSANCCSLRVRFLVPRVVT